MKEISEKDFEQESFDADDFLEIDALIEYLRELPRREVQIINPARVMQFRFAGAMAKKVLRDTKCNAKIKCHQDECMPSVGVIDIEGDSIDIVDIEGFSRVGEFANNVEVYPLTNGKVRMSYSFYRLMVSPDKLG